MKRHSIRVAALLLCLGATSCPSSEKPAEQAKPEKAKAEQPAPQEPSANQIRENALRSAPQQVRDQVQRVRFQSATNRRKVQEAIDNK